MTQNLQQWSQMRRDGPGAGLVKDDAGLCVLLTFSTISLFSCINAAINKSKMKINICSL